jgi:hypothetical protein
MCTFQSKIVHHSLLIFLASSHSYLFFSFFFMLHYFQIYDPSTILIYQLIFIFTKNLKKFYFLLLSSILVFNFIFSTAIKFCNWRKWKKLNLILEYFLLKHDLPFAQRFFYICLSQVQFPVSFFLNVLPIYQIL